MFLKFKTKNRVKIKKEKRSLLKRLSKSFTIGLVSAMLFPMLLSALIPITIAYADEEETETPSDAGTSPADDGQVDSNDRRVGNIQLGYQKQNGYKNTQGVSEEELRIIGIYLSNYYVPFSTEISNKANSAESQKKSKEKMVKALTTNMQFEKKMAQEIVNAVFTVSTNAEPLYFATGKKKDKEYQVTGVKNPQGSARKATYKEFLYMQYAADTFYTGSSYKYPYFRVKDESDRGYLYYGTPKADKEKIDKNKIVYDWNYFGKDITASQATFFNILSASDAAGTMATSVFDLDDTDVKGNDSESVVKAVFRKYGSVGSMEEIFNASFFNWGMYVDAFGNILVNTGSKTYVAIPACLNPYNFEGEGSEIGQAMPINNMQSYAQYKKINQYKHSGESNKEKKLSFSTEYNAFTNSKETSTKFLGADVDFKHLYLKLTSNKGLTNWDYGDVDLGAKLMDALVSQDMVTNFSWKGFEADGGQKVVDYFNDNNKGNYWKILDDGKDVARITRKMLGKGLVNQPAWEAWKKNYPYNPSTVFASESTKDYMTIAYPKAVKDATIPYIAGLAVPDQVGTLMGKDSKIDPSTIKATKSYLENGEGFESADTDQYKKETKERGGVVTIEGNENFNTISANVYLTYILTAAYDGKSKSDKYASEFDDEDSSGSSSSDSSTEQVKNKEDETKDSSKAKDSSSSTSSSAKDDKETGDEDEDGEAKTSTSKLTEDEIKKVKEEFGFILTCRNMPEMTEGIGSTESEMTEMSDEHILEMQTWTYYFLHPTQGAKYLGRWFQTKVNGIMLYIHRAITGANEGQSTTGLSKYIGFSGYATMPSLTDMAWTQNLLKLYSDYSIFLIIFVVIILIIHVLLGELSVARGIFGIIFFILCLSIPPTAIQFAVDTSNAVANSIFSKKFNYWAMVQNQAYISKYNEVAKDGTAGEGQNYVNGLLTLQGLDNNTQGMYENNSTLGASVTIKWMTPKKNQFLKQVQEELESRTASSAAMSLLTQTILRKSLSGETYDQNTNSVYLYRNFADIGNYSRVFYGNTQGETLFDGTGSIAHNFDDYQASMNTIGLSGVLNNYLGTSVDKNGELKEGTLKYRIEKGFVNAEKNSAGSTNIKPENFKRIYGPISATRISKVANTKIANVALGDFVGIEEDAFKASMNNLNNHTVTVKESIKFTKDFTSEQLVSNGIFGIFSESPFYYFSWNLYDNKVNPQPDTRGGFKSLMLRDNSKFFYNYAIPQATNGYGAMKDYLDMASLFNVVIPYMKKANQPVKEWSEKYGAYPYTGIPSDDDSATKYTDKNSEAYYKYWHNNNLSRLYNQYTAWVDAMYDTDYAKPTTITFAGKTQVVKDPIDPRSYKLRPMVFSETEMLYYGLKESDLTEVEKKIMNVEEQTRLDMLPLMNYHNYDDVVLNNAASMIATFNFNKEFSQRSYMKKSYELYPQDYELKNFTYDAYLRLILAEATGESIQTSNNYKYTDIYERVVEKGNIFTGIFIVINDLMAMYIIPFARLLALVVFFLLGVVIIILSAVRKEINLGKSLGKSFLLPMISFLAINVALAFVISLFISNGQTAVTGSLSTTISLGDPTVTLIALLAINIVVIGGFGYILFKSIQELVSYAKIGFTALKVSIEAAASAVGSAVAGVAGTVSNVGGGTGASSDSESYNSDNIEERGERNTRDGYDDGLEEDEDIKEYDINNGLDGDLNDFDIEKITEEGRKNLIDDDIKDIDSDFEVDSDEPVTKGEVHRQRAEDMERQEKIDNLNKKYSKDRDEE